MKIINKIKSFFTPKTTLQIIEEEELAYQNLDLSKVHNPFLQCHLCNYVRTNQDMKDSIRDYKKSFMSINGITKCYKCLELERKAQPHCKSCTCNKE